MRVLVADDVPEGRRLLEVLLQRWKYDVVTARDGRVALERLHEPDVEMAVLDWMMPVLDGLDVCRAVRAEPALESRYLILLTGRAEKQDVVEGLDAGADDYLVKPVDASELRARLRVGERVLALQHKLARRVEQVRDARRQVRRLEGLIPICAYCKRVRNEEEYWDSVERYISERSDVEFTHGICPDCLAKVDSAAET